MEDEATALGLLETRVEQLESRVVGKRSINEMNISKIKPVLQSLHEVDTVLLSSLSGKKKINALLKKIDILERILDPSYLDVRSDTDAKAVSILESEEKIRNYTENCARLKELEPILNDETIQKLPALKGRIDKLLSNALKQKEKCDQQTENVLQVLNDYQQYTLQVSALLTDLEAMITNLEIESKAKLVED